MFQFRAFPAYTYLIQCTLTRYCRSGFPHSEISGSMRMCRSPKLIAACHVLHRLLMPRHSPCALISLTYVGCAVAACEASLAMLRRFAPAILLFRSKPASLGFGSSGRTFFSPTFWFSVRIMQVTEVFDRSNCSSCYPNSTILFSKQHSRCFTLCCLASSSILHCSVFKVQIRRYLCTL